MRAAALAGRQRVVTEDGLGEEVYIVGAVWRRRLLLSGGVLLIAAVIVYALFRPGGGEEPKGGVERTAGPPNVVLIVIDTLRADAMGVYGHPLETSPELDSLANGGVRFARTVAQSSWTRPSFASFLTSHYPRASGITQEQLHGLPESQVTLAEVLSNAGYTTLGVTSNPNVNSTFRFDQGFDAYSNSGVRFDWMGVEALPTDKLAGQVPLRSAPEVFEEALSLLDEYERPGQPVYLQLVVMEVHERTAGPDQTRLRRALAPHPDAPYLAALRYVSAEIDRFLKTLRRRPSFDNTLVIVMSDHGEGLRSHPHVLGGDVHGYLVYESQTVVPLILNDFGRGLIPAGTVVQRPVRLLDLMPTVLDILGIQGPRGMEGRSLRPLLAGNPVTLPEYFVVESHFRNAHAIGVYGDGFAYVENRRPVLGTLPRELHRLGGAQDGAYTDLLSSHAEEGARLASFLAAWERAHPQAEPAPIGQQVSEQERNQLRALGYVE